MWGERREWERKGELASAGSLPKCLQKPRLWQSKPGSQECHGLLPPRVQIRKEAGTWPRALWYGMQASQAACTPLCQRALFSLLLFFTEKCLPLLVHSLNAHHSCICAGSGWSLELSLVSHIGIREPTALLPSVFQDTDEQKKLDRKWGPYQNWGCPIWDAGVQSRS